MRDYTYQDMLRMQEDAANRVREMKKRAAIAVEEDSKDDNRSLTSIPDEVRHISYPVELPVVQPDDALPEKEESHTGLLEVIKNDMDAILIMGLIALLSDSEQHDQLISLALLYLLL